MCMGVNYIVDLLIRVSKLFFLLQNITLHLLHHVVRGIRDFGPRGCILMSDLIHGYVAECLIEPSYYHGNIHGMINSLRLLLTHLVMVCLGHVLVPYFIRL